LIGAIAGLVLVVPGFLLDQRDRESISDMKHISIVASFFMLAVFPLMTHAKTHLVSVQTSFFAPNNLVIQAGDTVVWTDSPQLGECENGDCPPVIMHNVMADDQSFSSGAPGDGWTFQQTFDEPGIVFYHCEVHSSPGQDINEFMNGRINVQEVEEEPFLINVAMTDAWFFPDTAGQGFFIVVWEDKKLVFLSWFTYDTMRPPDDVSANLGEPGHRWLTALGPYEGDTALLDVFLSEGMIFDSAEPPVATEQLEGASIEIVWTGCNEAVLKYNIPSSGVSGEIPIQRIVLDKAVACEALANP
jgi:plastocyanin